MRTPTKSLARAAKREANRTERTADSFQNFVTRVGLGTDNQNSAGTYGFYPITRLRIILDFAYRSSWVCRAAVQQVAKDMVRGGIGFGSDIDPKDADRLHKALGQKHGVHRKLRETIQWARLYGGAGAFIMVDGQKPDTPLDIERIGRGGFNGLLPLDRWMLDPSLGEIVADQESLDYGKPKYYRITSTDTPLHLNTKIHHTRFIRFDGDDLPYYQKLSENLWGMSVLEPIWDRLLAFDATTSGISQLVNRAHLRHVYVEAFREIVGGGGKRLDALLAQVDWMRRFQTNEGITIVDAKDRIENLQYAFTGLDAVLIQMGQQISGAIRIPLVILFGQSPAGFSTGETDVRMYYDGIGTEQEDSLRPGLDKIIRVVAMSEGIKLSSDFSYSFNPLYKMTDEQKASAGSSNTSTALSAFEGGLVSRATALKELKQQSKITGAWSNISDEDIKEAENEPPAPGMEGEEPPGAAGFLPGGEAGEYAQEPAFLPGAKQKTTSSFLPGARKEQPDESDSAGSFAAGELEAGGGRPKKPIFHVYVNRDQDYQGRATKFAGYDVVIERDKGEARTEGSSGGAVMTAPYGHFPGTVANDGDSLDVFLGENEKSNVVYVIETCNPETKQYHQPKVFLGFSNTKDVLGTFYSFYADGRGQARFLRAIEFTAQDFSKWIDRFRVREQAAQ